MHQLPAALCNTAASSSKGFNFYGHDSELGEAVTVWESAPPHCDITCSPLQNDVSQGLAGSIVFAVGTRNSAAQLQPRLQACRVFYRGLTLSYAQDRCESTVEASRVLSELQCP